jgi:hypothetical protein
MHDAKRYVGQALQRGEDHRLITAILRSCDRRMRTPWPAT